MKALFVCFVAVAPLVECLAQAPKPIVMLNGQIVKDTTAFNNFDRIDYLPGKKGVELFGPKGGNGVIIIQADGEIPVYGEVSSTTGKKIKGAEVVSKDGNVLTVTNHCGTFFLPYLAIGETVTVRKKGYDEQRLVIQQTEFKIELKRKKK
ncbi:MAG: carboxypeptidase-like regulatory domain-containing protein [Cytophagales bacterium]